MSTGMRYFPVIYMISCTSIGVLFLIFNYFMNTQLSHPHTRSRSSKELRTLYNDTSKEKVHVTTSKDATSNVTVVPDKFVEVTYDTKNTNRLDNDVLVFLHIEKTGGSSFERILLTDTVEPPPCNCSVSSDDTIQNCACMNSHGKSWLFSRKTSIWACGVHPDLTRLRHCVPEYLQRTEGATKQRRLHYFTILRDPYYRYLSEWQHVNRGTTWRGAVHGCSETLPQLRNMSLCHKGAKWSDVSLKDFLGCDQNPASNRLTWMLASLDKIGCSRLKDLPSSELKKQLLHSAKTNLRDLAFFGIEDHRSDMLSLFGKRFNVKFKTRSEKEVGTPIGREVSEDIDSNYRRKIHDHIELDTELYNYAKKLYKKRYGND